MKLFSLMVFLFLALLSSAQTTDLSFLEGTWKVTDKDVYETWTKIDDAVYKGEAYTVKDGKKKVAEVLDINATSGKLTYFATVIGKNDDKPVGFKLKQLDDTTYSFENSQHDFPKKIIYKVVAEDELFIRVLGINDEGFDFTMRRREVSLKTDN